MGEYVKMTAKQYAIDVATMGLLRGERDRLLSENAFLRSLVSRASEQGELKCSQAAAVPRHEGEDLRPACDVPNASAVGSMSAAGGQPPADAACHAEGMAGTKD
jgi:hypothetical protein